MRRAMPAAIAMITLLSHPLWGTLVRPDHQEGLYPAWYGDCAYGPRSAPSRAPERRAELREEKDRIIYQSEPDLDSAERAAEQERRKQEDSLRMLDGILIDLRRHPDSVDPSPHRSLPHPSPER